MAKMSMCPMQWIPSRGREARGRAQLPTCPSPSGVGGAAMDARAWEPPTRGRRTRQAGTGRRGGGGGGGVSAANACRAPDPRSGAEREHVMSRNGPAPWVVGVEGGGGCPPPPPPPSGATRKVKAQEIPPSRATLGRAAPHGKRVGGRARG